MNNSTVNTATYDYIFHLYLQKSILSLRLLENGTLLSGGLDGRLEAWDANKYFNTPIHEIQVRKTLSIQHVVLS